MTREEKYKEQLREIGVYREAFDPEISMLAMMERELQRMVKGWKAEGSPAKSKLHEAIIRQRRDILAHRDALGLTPKGLHRLTGKSKETAPEESGQITALKMIQGRRRDSA